MHDATTSIVLLGISLILLIIYGIDVLVASIASPEVLRGQGFLPFEEQVRGIVFGGGAVVLSIIAFIFSRTVPSKTTSILLFINGGLIVVGIIVTVLDSDISSEDIGSMGQTVGSTIILGLLLVGLGSWKIILDQRILSRRRAS